MWLEDFWRVQMIETGMRTSELAREMVQREREREREAVRKASSFVVLHGLLLGYWKDGNLPCIPATSFRSSSEVLFWLLQR